MSYYLHKLTNIRNLLYRQPNNIYILFAVLTRLQLLTIVQQIEQFPTVYLEERDRNGQVRILHVPYAEYILSTQVVHARTPVLEIPVHGVSFATARLPVREASHLGPQESALDNRPDALVVQLRGMTSTC